jgi:hypothetical protein
MDPATVAAAGLVVAVLSLIAAVVWGHQGSNSPDIWATVNVSQPVIAYEGPDKIYPGSQFKVRTTIDSFSFGASNGESDGKMKVEVMYGSDIISRGELTSKDWSPSAITFVTEATAVCDGKSEYGGSVIILGTIYHLTGNSAQCISRSIPPGDTHTVEKPFHPGKIIIDPLSASVVHGDKAKVSVMVVNESPVTGKLMHSWYDDGPLTSHIPLPGQAHETLSAENEKAHPADHPCDRHKMNYQFQDFHAACRIDKMELGANAESDYDQYIKEPLITNVECEIKKESFCKGDKIGCVPEPHREHICGLPPKSVGIAGRINTPDGSDLKKAYMVVTDGAGARKAIKVNSSGRFEQVISIGDPVFVEYGTNDGLWKPARNLMTRKQLSDLNLLLVPRFAPAIGGQILDQDGKPLLANIFLVNPNKRDEMRKIDFSNENGYFSIRSLPLSEHFATTGAIVRIEPLPLLGRRFQGNGREIEVLFDVSDNVLRGSIAPVALGAQRLVEIFPNPRPKTIDWIFQFFDDAEKTIPLSGLEISAITRDSSVPISSARTDRNGRAKLSIPFGAKFRIVSANYQKFLIENSADIEFAAHWPEKIVVSVRHRSPRTEVLVEGGNSIYGSSVSMKPDFVALLVEGREIRRLMPSQMAGRVFHFEKLPLIPLGTHVEVAEYVGRRILRAKVHILRKTV